MKRIVFGRREDKKLVEAGDLFSPKFDADGLIPAMAVDHATGEPLMLAYMNEESLKMTLELGEAVYYSRSRREIWHKGKTSGHIQVVKEILTDCDQDALIVRVDQLGAGACHTGYRTCFYREVVFGDELKALEALEAVENEGDEVVVPLRSKIGEKSFDAEAVYKK